MNFSVLSLGAATLKERLMELLVICGNQEMILLRTVDGSLEDTMLGIDIEPPANVSSNTRGSGSGPRCSLMGPVVRT